MLVLSFFDTEICNLISLAATTNEKGYAMHFSQSLCESSREVKLYLCFCYTNLYVLSSSFGYLCADSTIFFLRVQIIGLLLKICFVLKP